MFLDVETMKQVLETSEEIKKRVHNVANNNGLNAKQATTAMLAHILPSFESGKMRLGTPTVPVIEGDETRTEEAA